MALNIRGLDRLFKRLDAVAATDVLVPPMHASTLRVQRRMQDYPPAPSGSRYRRTGTYGRRWTERVTRRSNGVEGRVGNRTIYAPLVGSERFQARVHRGRWVTDRRVLREEQDAIERTFQQAVDRALGG